jgi:hypothetical protein
VSKFGRQADFALDDYLGWIGKRAVHLAALDLLYVAARACISPTRLLWRDRERLTFCETRPPGLTPLPASPGLRLPAILEVYQTMTGTLAVRKVF